MIAGTILVVLQLRVNARNVRSRNAFDLIAKVIDPTFPHRRHLLYEVADTFQPIRTHIIDEAGKAFPALKDNRPGLDAIYWPNLGWLAEESRKWTLQRASDGTGWKPPD